MPTADVTFSVSNASSDLTFKCEVATSAGDKLAYRVQWFVEKDMEQEMLLGTSQYAELHASNINKDISLKKVTSVLSDFLALFVSPSPSASVSLSPSPSTSLSNSLSPPFLFSLSQRPPSLLLSHVFCFIIYTK